MLSARMSVPIAVSAIPLGRAVAVPALVIGLLAGCASQPGADASAPLPVAAPQSFGTGMSAGPPPAIGGCQIFPAPGGRPHGNAWWNTDISTDPVDPKSAAYIREIQHDGMNQTHLHPDFGHNSTYGLPFVVVPASQPMVPIAFDAYGSQSDRGPYPIPPNAPLEGGPNAYGDRHVLVLQQGTCTLYELYHAHRRDRGAGWVAGAGAVFHLNSDRLRPNGWTSADAAGLPILPALVKCDEVRAGAIDHALRVTFNYTQDGYIHPATHFADYYTPNDLPPMGLRLRLRASFDISGFKGQARVILVAMKKYGMIVADDGYNWYFQGEGTGNHARSCWDDNNLDTLKRVSGNEFEAVETGPILRTTAP